MPESPRDLRRLRAAVDDANEQIRAHARRDSWTELDQQRHTMLVGEWQRVVEELQAAGREGNDEAGPAVA